MYFALYLDVTITHAVVTAPRGPRAIKETLGSRHGNWLTPYLMNGTVDPACYRDTLKKIHTNVIAKLSTENAVLNAVPPEIDATEKRLTRIQRTTLSQLRSGSCKLLNNFKVMLGHAQSALCPECMLSHGPTHIPMRRLSNHPLPN